MKVFIFLKKRRALIIIYVQSNGKVRGIIDRKVRGIIEITLSSIERIVTIKTSILTLVNINKQYRQFKIVSVDFKQLFIFLIC